jgi:Protein of unknown function (DUF3302)
MGVIMKQSFLQYKKIGVAVVLGAIFLPQQAHASIFHGETLDKIADVISWVALILAPIIGIVAFWLIHILPEKIAEKKRHPQAKAIQTLCLLSLAFGGLLWPLAWLWAYTKPVGYKLAYGTDVAEEELTDEEKQKLEKSKQRKREEKKASMLGLQSDPVEVKERSRESVLEELQGLRERLNELSVNAPDDQKLSATIRQIAELEKQFAGARPTKGEKD